LKKVFLFVPLLAVVGLLFVKPPSIAHNNPLPTSSTQATITNSATSSTHSNVVQESSVKSTSVSTKSPLREENLVATTAPSSKNASTSSVAPNIGGKGGDDEHEGREHEGREREGRERHGDDDGGRLPKPPSNH